MRHAYRGRRLSVKGRAAQRQAEAEIVLRGSGLVGIWQMDGGRVETSATANASNGWSVAATRGDYDGDGKSDVLLTTPGAVAVWHPGAGGASSYGHVAYVEAVGPDGGVPAGSFLISEMNWGGWNRVSRRVLSDNDPAIAGFIYGKAD